MIVGSTFKGDNQNKVMVIQHNTYFENLSKLVLKAQSRYVDAIELLSLDDNIPLDRINFNSFDHRKYQIYHDIIAAYFRFKNHSKLEQTLFESNQENLDRIKNDWLIFWNDEVEILTQNNYWVQAIILLAVSFDEDKIDNASKSLMSIINNRYNDFIELMYL